MDCCDSKSLLNRFREKHARVRAHATRKLERSVVGLEVGLNGYTTVEEANHLSDQLGTSTGDWFLEVGAGRGWPGWYVSKKTGSHLLAIDIPFDAMAAAQDRFVSSLPKGRGRAVVADGVMLSVRDNSIDGVIHADMLCCVPDKLSVLRESHRVLKRKGRIVGYLIHTPSGLSISEKKRASHLGPSAVNADESPQDLASMAGFSVLAVTDVTEQFRNTVRAIIQARVILEEELRREEGDAIFEEELQGEQDVITGIEEGLLFRSLLLAAKT